MKYLIFFIFIFTFLYLIFNTHPASADGISLSVSPSLLQVEVAPPTDTKVPLALQNQGTEPLNIQVLFKPFRPYGEAGQIEYIERETGHVYREIFSKVMLSDHGIVTTHFDLGPKQKKTLELRFDIPKNERASDYYFSVIFLASPSELTPNVALSEDQNFSTINAGIAANVLLSIGSTNQPQGAIEEFSAPSFLQSGPVEFKVRIKNTGPHLITPKGIIFIKNMFGQTIGRLDISPANILSNTTRSLAALATSYDGDTQTASASSTFSASPFPLQTEKTLWPEKFLLGPYTATLNLAISEKGPIYNQSIIFLVMPLQLIIGTIFAIIIIIAIILRVRYHLKKDK